MAIGREKRLQRKAHKLVSSESDPKAMALKLVSKGLITILMPLLRDMPGGVLSSVLTQSASGTGEVPTASVEAGGPRTMQRARSMARFFSDAAVKAASDPIADVIFAKMKKAPANELRELFELISCERVVDLSNLAKAVVLRSIARTWDEVDGEPAIACVNIIHSATGRDLEHLKLAFDTSSGDSGVFDLSWFVYKVVQTPARYEILQHFAVDAALTSRRVRSSSTSDLSSSSVGVAASSAAPDCAPPAYFQLLSDIDDTFYCSFLDRRYPRHCVYPGVVEFYSRTMQGQQGRKLPVFLSARPRGYKGVGARVTIKQLQHRMGLEEAHITMLLGEVKTGFSNKKIALKKFSNFREVRPPLRLCSAVRLALCLSTASLSACEVGIPTHPPTPSLLPLVLFADGYERHSTRAFTRITNLLSSETTAREITSLAR